MLVGPPSYCPGPAGKRRKLPGKETHPLLAGNRPGLQNPQDRLFRRGRKHGKKLWHRRMGGECRQAGGPPFPDQPVETAFPSGGWPERLAFIEIEGRHVRQDRVDFGMNVRSEQTIRPLGKSGSFSGEADDSEDGVFRVCARFGKREGLPFLFDRQQCLKSGQSLLQGMLVRTSAKLFEASTDSRQKIVPPFKTGGVSGLRCERRQIRTQKKLGQRKTRQRHFRKKWRPLSQSEGGGKNSFKGVFQVQKFYLARPQAFPDFPGTGISFSLEQRLPCPDSFFERQILETVQRVVVNKGVHRPGVRKKLHGQTDPGANINDRMPERGIFGKKKSAVHFPAPGLERSLSRISGQIARIRRGRKDTPIRPAEPDVISDIGRAPSLGRPRKICSQACHNAH